MTIIPMQQVTKMANAILSDALAKISEIDSLTTRRNALSEAVDFWNRWMLWGLVIAAVAAAWIVLTTRLTVLRSQQLSAAQGELDLAKDRQLQTDLKEKDVEIGNLKMKSETAEAGITSAQAEAARANLLAEQERLARVKLEKQLAPRMLSEKDRQDIADHLRMFTPNFVGRKVTISSQTGDAEGMVFALEIMDIMTRAGIDVDPAMGRLVPVGGVYMGTRVSGPSSDEQFIRTLVNDLNFHLEAGVDGEWKPAYTELDILVGVKPIAGIPSIAKQPTE